jgi:DNA-binding CsgD family transcriptional regulator
VSLVGREAEHRALDGVLAAAREGRSAAVVVHGPAGFGKSALLDHVAGGAPDFQVFRLTGVEAEQQLGFAALQRMLIPFTDRFDDLPGPQRLTVRSAFGLESGPPADRFLMGLATLSLLTDAATERPVLCLVDDTQWIDQESLEALGLVGRRLYAERVVLVFATRDGRPGGLAGLHEVALRPLPDEEATSLVRAMAGEVVDDHVASSIAREAGGSPLVITELVNHLTNEQLSGAAPLPDPLPVGSRLESHFLRQVRALPPETQTLVLVAAAAGSDGGPLVTAAASRLGVAPSAAEPAEAAGILVPGAGFRHPLIRSAVYGAAPAAERRRVHGALAASTDPSRDRVRRAWHLAAATIGPDEPVATEIEQAAAAARARGSTSAAGALLVKAAELTEDEHRRVERVLAAANAELAGGAPVRARQVLTELASDVADPLQAGLVQRLHGRIGYALGEAHGTARLLMDAALVIVRFDRSLARATLLEALAAARVTGAFTAAGAGEADVGALVRRMPFPSGTEPAIVDLLLDGDTALFLEGYAAAVDPLRRAIAALVAHPTDTVESLEWLAIGCWAAGALGDDDGLRVLARRLVEAADALGDVVWYSIGLMFLAMSELLDGSLDAASGHFSERAELMAAIGRPADVGGLVISAWRGDERRARAEADALTRYATDRGHGWMLVFVDYALVVLELGLGNYAAAFATATKDERANPFLSIAAHPDLIVAAVRCGEREAALAAVEEYRVRAEAIGTSTALGFLARSEALLADDDSAEEHYRRAIGHFRLRPGDLQGARAHLLYGEWLRRRKRRLEARTELRIAHETFLASGAAAFAERARMELAATGEHVRRRAVDTATELTSQEAQIASLAAQHRTNAEIAAKLFLSASTVDYHLRKVYRKLGISSRRMLSPALAAVRGTVASTPG